MKNTTKIEFFSFLLYFIVDMMDGIGMSIISSALLRFFLTLSTWWVLDEQ